MLKNLFFTFIFTTILYNSTSAQNGFFVAEEIIDSVLVDVDISESFKYFTLRTVIGNDSEETVEISWRHQIADNCPNQWRMVGSDQHLDYILQEIPGSVIPNVLEPNIMDAHFTLLFQPQTVAGCCDVQIDFFADSEPNEILASTNFHIEINEPNCLQTSVEELITADFKIFPNPVSNAFFINEEIDFLEFHIFSVHGQLIKTFPEKLSDGYSIREIPAGIYFVNGLTENGQHFSQKIVKQ